MLRREKLRMCGKSEVAGVRLGQKMKQKAEIRIGMAASSLLDAGHSLGPQLSVQRVLRIWP